MANYKVIHTKIGLQLLAQVAATGTKLELTHFAVGDGNGNPITVDPNMKQLVRERYRNTINRIYQDPENENLYTAEVLIPLSLGGFVMREIAVFDKNGNMILVGNLPDVIKPTSSDGIFTDSAIRIPFFVSNANTVELKIDPNVVTATQSWIVNTLTPAYFFPGGSKGQVLKKVSNIDGDTQWADASTSEVFVNTIEEEQTLATNQTVVDFTTVTTHGIAIYIDGNRITNKTGTDGWQATSSTSIKLGKSYTAGLKILAVQNEPLGDAPYPLQQKNNLSDLKDASVARQNLGVMSSDESKFNDCPPGTVISLATDTIPAGYKFVKCNGAALSRTVYADLFSAIGTKYGSGDGVTTFNVPDARGEFPRYWDDGKGIDSSRVIGSKQTQQVLKHKHLSLGESYTSPVWPFGYTSKAGYTGSKGGIDSDNYLYYTNDGSDYSTETVNASGVIGSENRPRNIAWMACIKY